MSDHIEVFSLPDVGEGLTEGEILAWHVQVGDVVVINQLIVEVETAKAAVELPSPFAGTVAELHARPGEVVPVGAPLISIAVAAAAPTRESVLVGYGVRHAGGAQRRARKASTILAAAPIARHQGPTRAKPLVRKLAKDLGVDLTGLSGSGRSGDVTRDDVLAAANGLTAANPTPPTGGDDRVPVRGVQRAMAEAMVLSAFTAPHVTVWVEVDMSRTQDLVRRLREHPSYRDLRVTPFTIVSSALIASACQHPRINASWSEGADGPDVIVHRDIHLGMAADTPRGLLVPVVRGAGAMTLLELARAQQALIETARLGRSTPADLVGGTVTLTNIGVFGVDGGTPIINPGQSAILAMGRIVDKPWAVDGEVRVRPVMQLSLSFDHRVCDGAQGSRALTSVATFLADPAAALLLNQPTERQPPPPVISAG